MEIAKKKGGRPRVASDRKRLKRVYFYVNNEELAALENERERVAKTRAMYLRELIFKERTPIHRVDSSALALINRMSNNINQIAARVNSAPREGARFMLFRDELNDIKNELRNIHFAILGGGATDESENNQGKQF